MAEQVKRKARPDVYVGLLCVSIAALSFGCMFFLLELEKYGWEVVSPDGPAPTVELPPDVALPQQAPSAAPAAPAGGEPAGEEPAPEPAGDDPAAG